MLDFARPGFAERAKMGLEDHKAVPSLIEESSLKIPSQR
jgi:hypothetical protein